MRAVKEQANAKSDLDEISMKLTTIKRSPHHKQRSPSGTVDSLQFSQSIPLSHQLTAHKTMGQDNLAQTKFNEIQELEESAQQMSIGDLKLRYGLLAESQDDRLSVERGELPEAEDLQDQSHRAYDVPIK